MGSTTTAKPPVLAAVLAAVLIWVAALGTGSWIGGNGTAEPSLCTADGRVGADQTSFQVGATTYGFTASAAGTDGTAASIRAAGRLRAEAPAALDCDIAAIAPRAELRWPESVVGPPHEPESNAKTERFGPLVRPSARRPAASDRRAGHG